MKLLSLKMKIDKKSMLFWTVFALLGVCYLWLKFFSPAVIESMYSRGSLEWLNKIAGQAVDQSVGYYLGAIEAKLTGPWGVVISSVLFLMVSLRYLPNAGMRLFGVSVFVFLLLTKGDVLLFPPYGDAIGGPFAEAIWLYRHAFNYVGLFHETRYIDGGPAVYVFSIYPTYLAVLMKLIPSTKGFLVVNHLLVFGFASIIVTLFREILCKVFNRRVAILSVALFMSLPLFHSQVEAINMEMFLLLLAMVSVFSLMQRRMMAASIFAALSAFIKGYGVIVCGVVFVSSLILFFGSPKGKKQIKVLLMGIGVAAAAVGAVILAYIVAYQFTPTRVTQIFSGWPSLKPTLTLKLYILSVLAYIINYIRSKKQKREDAFYGEPFFIKHFAPTVMFIFAGTWFLFFLNHFAVSPRYSLILLPFLIFCGVYAFHVFDRKGKWAPWIMIPLILFAAFCSYGFLYGPIDGYNYVLQERSLEYRNDLKLSLQIAREIEGKYDGFLIGAPFPVAQTLALPELGYVSKHLNVMIYRMPCTYGNIKNFKGLNYLDVSRTIWVGVKSGLPAGIPFPVDDQDIVLKKLVQGREEATIFQGGIAIEKARLMLEYLMKQKRADW